MVFKNDIGTPESFVVLPHAHGPQPPFPPLQGMFRNSVSRGLTGNSSSSMGDRSDRPPGRVGEGRSMSRQTGVDSGPKVGPEFLYPPWIKRSGDSL